MKLLRLVQLFILLVTIVSLMPSTHATTVTNNSTFNTYQVSPITLMARQSVDVTLTISWMAGGMPANPTPTFEYFTFSAPSSIAQTFLPQGASRLVITAAAPDSATVQLTGQLTDNGKTSPIRCNQQVTLQHNVPVQVGCIIFSVMLPPGACSRLFLPQCPPVDNNVRLTVQITNTG